MRQGSRLRHRSRQLRKSWWTRCGPDTAADIYGVGVILHYMLSGEYPVEAEQLEQLVAVHKDGAPMRLRNLRPDLPSAFVQVVERALARNPADRYATAGELQQALEKTRERSKQRRRVRRMLVAAGVGIAAIVAFAMFMPRPPARRRRFVVA